MGSIQKETSKSKTFAIYIMMLICVVASLFVVQNLYAVMTINTTIVDDLDAHAAFSETHKDAQKDIFNQRKDLVKALLKKNYFMAPPTKPKPPSVTAIVGPEALFGDKWYVVGDKVNGCEIKEILLNGAVIIWEGKEKTLQLTNVPSSNSSALSAPSVRRRLPMRQGRSGKGRAGRKEKKAENKAARGDNYDALLARMLDSVPEEYREKAIAHWNTLSDAEKKKAVKGFKKKNK